eukprot:11696-Heterococcus_DN1.PRE.3
MAQHQQAHMHTWHTVASVPVLYTFTHFLFFSSYQRDVSPVEVDLFATAQCPKAAVELHWRSSIAKSEGQGAPSCNARPVTQGYRYTSISIEY